MFHRYRRRPISELSLETKVGVKWWVKKRLAGGQKSESALGWISHANQPTAPPPLKPRSRLIHIADRSHSMKRWGRTISEVTNEEQDECLRYIYCANCVAPCCRSPQSLWHRLLPLASLLPMPCSSHGTSPGTVGPRSWMSPATAWYF